MNSILYEEKCELLPLPFQKLLNQLKLVEDVTDHELVFVAVLYNILESGFILCNEKFIEVETLGFNLKSLNLLDDLPLTQIYEKKGNGHINYEARLKLAVTECPEVTVLGQPSYTSTSKYLAVNIFTRHPYRLATHCFKLSNWIEISFDSYKFKDRGTFSTLVKNNLAVPIKNALVYYLNLNNAPVLNRLPDVTMDKICSFLNKTDKEKLNKCVNIK